ncbi:MBL fold metallo-hydrolase [Salinarimonas ramus]|uniref:MBL fold metallo-hydrolase n=1 Tax=Salinarimonas ramus TaxID=690164 RepID=A0A917Q804_9HYPH|nr:MBL fold metallo-hydrolase [Salinarimonas ramus]GGK29909.1 MBL fold metallo-hydrolase [Salinarimonas ramus]
MSETPRFDTSFDQEPGTCLRLSPLVRRVLAGNAGPVTFTGTCSYVVGNGEVAIVDPGPDDPAHLDALLAATAGERITHLVVTHTHRDHSPGAAILRERTGARVVGCAPHRDSRALAAGEANRMEAAGDRSYAPDQVLGDGERVHGSGWTLEAVATPGHTANHLAFALQEENALFSGDHVMAWSTTFIGPPDGAMGPYMASLSKVLARGESIYWPGHGGPVTEPARFVRAIIAHRRQREEAILARLRAGDETIPALVETVYRGLSPALKPAAALNVLAHLEDLHARALARADGAGLDARWRAA